MTMVITDRADTDDNDDDADGDHPADSDDKVWPETLLFCRLYVFIHFPAAFCTAHCALDLAKDHAP